MLHCTVLGWVIKSTSLAHHLHCTLLPSVINFHIKWSWNDERGKWECVIKSPLKSLPSLITSLENDHRLMTVGSSYEKTYIIIIWWAREVDIIREWWAREANLKFTWKIDIVDTFLSYPGFLATYGNLGSTPTKYTWKKLALGPVSLKGLDGTPLKNGT